MAKQRPFDFAKPDEFFESITKSKANLGKPTPVRSGFSRVIKSDSPHNKKGFVFNTK